MVAATACRRCDGARMNIEEPGGAAPEEDEGWPVGFLVVVGLAAFYLLVRFIQLGARLLDWVVG